MKHRMWLAILAGALLSSFAFGQTTSHFDVAGNASFSTSQMGASGSSAAQVDALGWQASGITHFNRWLSMTSEFTSSNPMSVNSVSLIGYTGPGTIKHYSVLAGPRINLPLRGGFTPFVQGLAGYDRASTSLTSGTTYVNGNETQIAYAFGGGAQIGLTHRVGLNVEGNYFGSEHTLAFTGWQPSHYQLSAGIVIRLLGVRSQPQIARERRRPQPTGSPNTESATASAVTEPPVSRDTQPTAPAVEVVNIQAPPPTVQAETKTQWVSNAPVVAPATPTIAQPTPAPAAVPKAEPVISAAVVVTPAPAIPAPAPVVQKQAPVVAPVPTQAAPATQQVAKVASAPAPIPTQAPVASPMQPAPVQQVTPAQQPDNSQPISLGEYARRLREKKQHSGSGSGTSW